METRSLEIPPHKLVTALRNYDLLPAIVFMPTRRKCDEAALSVANDRSQKGDPDKLQIRRELFEEFISENPEVKTHRHIKILLNAGVASHHAGHIPAWKLLVEKMMSKGLLNVIFATSTVAAGVDFPARTVVITNADSRGSDGWRPLRASELQQMTGRAGRRGKDNVGFTVLVPGQFQNARRIAELMSSPPDPLESRFRSTYTSMLNLLDAFGSFEQVREIAQKSFAHQRSAENIRRLSTEYKNKISSLESSAIEKGNGITLNDLRGFERLTSAIRYLESSLPAFNAQIKTEWAREHAKQGRVFTQERNRRRLYLIIGRHGDTVSAIRDDGQGGTFPVSKINRIFTTIYPINDQSIEEAFIETANGDNQPLTEPSRSALRSENESAAEILNDLVKLLAKGPKTSNDPTPDEQRLNFLWASAVEASGLVALEQEIEFHHQAIWLPFEQRARVLDHFGYIDFTEQSVTASGKWLADLRVDKPLLIGETIRHGILDDLEPPALVGVIAALASDPDRNYGNIRPSDELYDAIDDLQKVIRSVAEVEFDLGIEASDEINLSAAAAAEFWAEDADWSEIAEMTGAEEGDLFRLFSRTGEALIQIGHLKASSSKAVETARNAQLLVLREPVRQ